MFDVLRRIKCISVKQQRDKQTMIKCCFKPYQLYFSHTIARKLQWPIDWRMFYTALYSSCKGIVNTVCGIRSTTSIWTTYMSKYTKWTGWQINAKLWDYNTSKVFKTWTKRQSILSLYNKKCAIVSLSSVPVTYPTVNVIPSKLFSLILVLHAFTVEHW